MITRREFVAAGAALASAPLAQAQSFPSRPIKMIVPFPPGGTADIQARLIGQHMSQSMGQPIVIESKPGGGTIIGTGFVAKAPADGYTILLMANSFVINAKLHASTLPYEGMKAFEPIACMTNSPQVIAVNAASPHRSFKEWVDAAKAKPGTVSYATVGPATTQHIAGEMLQRATGTKLIYAPFAGGTQAVNSVLAGHVDTVLANLSEMSAHLEAGKLRALAVTTTQRLDALKQVPTVAESGYPGYEAAAWFGLSAPAGTPRDAVARLAEAVNAALSDAEVRKKLINVGLEPYYKGPADFAAHIAQQYERYSRVIDESGIKV
ncbi:MAG: tripartite tricarboxylate transporter substrate binding protein [Ramlibacter sp.]